MVVLINELNISLELKRCGFCPNSSGNCFFFKYFIYLFLERGNGGGGESEEEKQQLVASCMCPGLQTSNRLFCEMTPTEPSHTGQGSAGKEFEDLGGEDCV